MAALIELQRIIADATLETIEDAAHGRDNAEDPPRYGYRLKASNIGNACERELWFEFRWAYDLEETPARNQRIFNAGHRIEADVVRDLSMKLEIVETGEDGKQLGASFADGHGYGKLDGYVWSGIDELPATDGEVGQAVLEVKSAKNTDFNAIVKHGPQKKKQLHYSQFQLYCRLWGVEHAFYVVECKNTSKRHMEIFAHDIEHTDWLFQRASRIAYSEARPARAYEKRDSFGCRFCKSQALCWGDKYVPPRSCRTCTHVTPLSGGKWACGCRNNKWLSRSEQEVGCDKHLYNPAFINGDIVGGDGLTHVIYQYEDGEQFVDTQQRNVGELEVDAV